jgi:hypothetical protein
MHTSPPPAYLLIILLTFFLTCPQTVILPISLLPGIRGVRHLATAQLKKQEILMMMFVFRWLEMSVFCKEFLKVYWFLLMWYLVEGRLKIISNLTYYGKNKDSKTVILLLLFVLFSLSGESKNRPCTCLASCLSLSCILSLPLFAIK